MKARPYRVALVSDGTAALGAGGVRLLADRPAMEAKAALFAQLADLDVVPVWLSVGSTDELVTTVLALASTFDGINLADIAAPRCCEVERRLQAALDIPVLSDRHAAAVVVLAGLRNALRLVGKQLRNARIVVLCAGSVGTAVTGLLWRAGAGDVVVWTPNGMQCAGEDCRLREDTVWRAGRTNPRRVRGGGEQALKGADAVVGLSRAGALSRELVVRMASRPIVFALAIPEPEIRPERLAGLDAVVATCRSDYPNRVDPALVLPGLFRGAFNAQARRVTTPTLLAAADVLAGLVDGERLSATRLLPDMPDGQLVSTLTAAIAAVEASWRRAG